MSQTDHATGSPPSLTEHAADGQGRDDAGVLLGLEPPVVEKAGENLTMAKDSNPSTCYAPLLGTIFLFHDIREPSTKWRKTAILALVLVEDVAVDFSRSRPKAGHNMGHDGPGKI
jgi:hypothetical protein